MRQLWRAACGRLDLDVAAKAFWIGVLGKEPTDQQVQAMHPLRRLEMPPPPPKTETTKKAESKAGWSLIRQFFGQKKR